MKRLAIFLFSISCSFCLVANNIQVGIPTVSATNELVFTLSWDNSWNVNSAPNNWDGVYLFAKYRNCASTGAWSHVELSTTVADHTVGAPLEVHDYLMDGKGLIVKRSAIGTGNISTLTVRLQMTLPNNTATYDFKVFGIEMVYIPTGQFYLGDGTSTTQYSFKHGWWAAGSAPYQVTSDGLILTGGGAGRLSSFSTSTISGSLPVSFPVGYDSLYVMKYEITQGQWVSFLNTLSLLQSNNRFVSISGANRINCTGNWPAITSSTPHRAMGRLSWADIAAFLDWAAIRPMTETEYEKICRGPTYPVQREYAWGTSMIVTGMPLLADGTSAERNSVIPSGSSGIANFNMSGLYGVVRNGFAASSTSNRRRAGASYYGVMEMTGNVFEMCIGIYRLQGRLFTRNHGDGILTTQGLANVPTWPTIPPAITVRGGGFLSNTNRLRVSNRTYYISGYPGSRQGPNGGRGIR